MTTCPSCSSTVEDSDKVCPVCKTALVEPKYSKTPLFRKLDVILASVCLTAMILVVLCQIILRNFFHGGLAFGDDLVRHLVLWVVFLGAGIAARENRHIKIDVMARFFSPEVNRYVDAIVAVFSTGVCLVLSYAAFTFVREEFGSGFTMNMFNMPVWILQTIIPAGYLIITVHLALSGIASFLNKGKGH
ncbi:MAG: TRAP transporter small permease [Desulfobacteraceae bacterium]